MPTKTKRPAPQREFAKTPIWDAEFADWWERLHEDEKPPAPTPRPRRPKNTK